MITAVYTRVSTKKQDDSMQEREISSFLQYKGLDKRQDYPDEGYSGKNIARPSLTKLINDIKKGLITNVVIWKLDRLGRNLQDLLELTKLFKDHNVNLMSVKDNIDMSTLNGSMYMQLLGVFAQYERDLIKERTRAGLANAVAKGVKLGRPMKLSLEKRNDMIELRKKGKSFSAISKELNINVGSVHYYLTKGKSNV